jgi:ABC-type multidrug transport system fused ATPase/permease subunit
MGRVVPSGRRGLIRQVRRAWTLVHGKERRRLQLVAAYGILIAGLDTIALILLFAMISVLDGQPATGITKVFFSGGQLSSDERYREALILLTATAVLFVLRSLLSSLGLWLTVGATNAAQEDLVSRLLVGYARAPHLTRLERNSSETLRTIGLSVSQVVSGIIGGSVSLVSNVAVSVAVLLGLVLSSPLVALTVAVYFAAIAAVWIRGVRGGLARRGLRILGLQEEQFRLVMQGLSAAKELQLRGRALFYADEAVARTRSINAAGRGVAVVNGSLRYVLETALVIGAVVIVAVAGLIAGRDAALPAVGLVLAAAFRLLPALNQVLFLYHQVQYNGPAIDLVEEELKTFVTDAPPPPSPAQAAASPLQLRDALRLEEVTFRYPTRTEPALAHVSFAVRAGESVGIVGPTGAGKSTLLDVLLGFLAPDSGSITVDGTPMAVCREAWQRSIGYVPQDVYLVDDSLRVNVALGWRGDDIDDEAVDEAIRLAQLDDVVRELPDGLETVVGERGVRLSGGQRQRLGIARALYVRPTVLILDEATSNLDTATEQRIVDTLAGLRRELTTIIVTHRLSTVRDCDRILYLDKGSLRLAGTFDDLTSFLSDSTGPVWPDPITAAAG